MADRLHTMRTLRSLPLDDKERLKIAEEALNVYAPLAHRMGVMKVKGELEDLAFKILHPQMFQVTNNTHTHINLSKVLYFLQECTVSSASFYSILNHIAYSSHCSFCFLF